MFDATLRTHKDRVLAPMTVRLGGVPPLVLSVGGLLASLGAAVAAWRTETVAAVALWLLGRLLDGLDGAVARRSGRASDLGGLTDIVLDTIAYSAIPLGLAAAADERGAWIATAFLLATFYVNAVSWAYLSALLAARGSERSGPTSAPMPRGLVEGAETIMFFTLALAVPAWATTVWWIMSAAVAVTIVERLWWATRRLR